MTSPRRSLRTSEPASFAFDDDGIARPLVPVVPTPTTAAEPKRELCPRCGQVHIVADGRACP